MLHCTPRTRHEHWQGASTERYLFSCPSAGFIIRIVSSLRRLVLSDRLLFITCGVHGRRRILSESEFACLARVIRERREEHHFLLTAWGFLPNPATAGRAIFFPSHPLTISDVMESIKVGSTRPINIARAERGLLWQPRFFDRALRTVKEYNEKVEYIHLNPVKASLLKRPEDWRWSSVHDYAGSVNAPAGKWSPIPVDRVTLPAD